MKGKTVSFISFQSPQDRLFWFSRAGHILFLIYFGYAAYTLISTQNTLVHWMISLWSSYGGHPFPIDSPSAMGGLVLNTISSLLLCWWYWMVARLFRACEKGKVFSGSSVRLLRKIAKLFLFFAVVGFINQILVHMLMGPFPTVAPGQELGEQIFAEVRYIGFGMFGLQFNGIDLEPIAVALIIFIALGVLEEGRKVREEQDLTV